MSKYSADQLWDEIKELMRKGDEKDFSKKLNLPKRGGREPREEFKN